MYCIYIIYIYNHTYISYIYHILDINIGIPKMYDVFVDESPNVPLILLTLGACHPRRDLGPKVRESLRWTVEGCERNPAPVEATVR